MPDERTVCKVCFQPVDRVCEVPYKGAPKEEWKVAGWRHLRKSDVKHDVVPIKAKDAPFIDQVCDFCGEPNIAWVFPVSPEKHRVFLTTEFEDVAWAACQPCHDDILVSLTGRQLAQRIAPRSIPLKQVPAHLRDTFLNQVLADQYQQFLEGRSGPPITLSEFVS